MLETSIAMTPQLASAFSLSKRLSPQERFMLAKLLLDTLITNEAADALDWMQLGLASFEADWDNPDDAIYDNWQEHYGVSTLQTAFDLEI